MMLWTAVDEDTLRQCKSAIKRCEERRVPPMPWFSLLIRMYRELDRAGLLRRSEVEQENCIGCVWAREGGCEMHFEGARVEQGKVLFCPNKITKEMREHQLKLHKRKGRAQV